jgi:hypothetical protein
LERANTQRLDDQREPISHGVSGPAVEADAISTALSGKIPLAREKVFINRLVGRSDPANPFGTSAS